MCMQSLIVCVPQNTCIGFLKDHVYIRKKQRPPSPLNCYPQMPHIAPTYFKCQYIARLTLVYLSSYLVYLSYYGFIKIIQKNHYLQLCGSLFAFKQIVC